MQATVSTKTSNRQARQTRDERLMKFEALADFANLGDEPADWVAFRTKWPYFFPTTPSGIDQAGFRTLSEWLYASAEEWASYPADAKAKVQPPLLWYRDRLRAVWTKNDPYGANLAILLGFEGRPDWLMHIIMKNAAARGETQIPAVIRRITEKEAQLQLVAIPPVVHPLIIPGQPTDFEKQRTFAGLPEGHPTVNPVNGSIGWEFGCLIQQLVSELVGQDYWRAMVCPECSRYFIAGKTAQRYCSSSCFGKAKSKASMEFYNRKGRFLRQKKSAKRRKTK
jgi:hypothetical protein